ncbi:MAG: hypothetical protein DRQ01_06610, partial [Ignavibacteriae bacterium]
SLVIVIFSNPALGQEYGKLRGFVTDSTNGEALAFGNVLIENLNIGASTNKHGMFLINKIPANRTHKVTVSYVGYKTKYISIFIKSGEMAEIDIALTPLSIELQTIEKIGEKIIEKNATDISLERISIKQVEILPKGVESDLFKAIQFLAGVRSTGDISARYYVRGGSSDQNLVQINGIDIYNPFHALGLFSAVDPEMINTVEFYKGGFPSEYSGRLSSVLSVISKDGNKKRFSFKGSASFLTAKSLVEGPIPNGSFILTGRKSYSNKVLKNYLNDKILPVDFYDLSFKLNYSSPDFLKNAKFILFGYASEDDLKYDDPARESINWRNGALGFEWLQVYDVPIFSRLGVSYSNFDGESLPNESNVKERKNEVADLKIKFDLNVVYDNRDELGVGIKFQAIDTKLFLQNTLGVNSSVERFATNISIYSKYKFLRWDDFGLDVGTRYNVTGLTSNGGGVFEPRVNLTYRISPEISLKGAWGIFQQELTTLSDENEVISIFEPWIIIPKYLSPSTAIHYGIGADIQILENLNLLVEGYYKILHNLPIINDEKIVESDPDLISGKGESYGWEFKVGYGFDPVSLSTSYTLSWAYKEIDNYIYYPNYDSRHALNFLLEFNLGSGWIASSIWNYNSGLPFTELIGYYDKFYLQNLNNVGQGVGEFRPFTILGDRNIGRLPAYHRLDFSLSKRLQISSFKFLLGVDVINAYNRENIFYYDRETGERVNMLPFMVTAVIKVEI